MAVILNDVVPVRHLRSATSGSCCSAIATFSRSAAAANKGNGSSRSGLDFPEGIAPFEFEPG